MPVTLKTLQSALEHVSQHIVEVTVGLNYRKNTDELDGLLAHMDDLKQLVDAYRSERTFTPQIVVNNDTLADSGQFLMDGTTTQSIKIP